MTAFVAPFAAILLCAATPTPMPGAPLRINAQGTFSDIAAWIYKTPQGTFGFTSTPAIGTNELLNVPPLSGVPSGSTPVGVFVKRHAFDPLGYPMHISLVDKLFAHLTQLTISMSTNGGLFTYDPKDPAAKEGVVQGHAAQIRYSGPIPADGPIPPDVQAAFSFAKQSLDAITNMPPEQKNLKNYGVLFIQDGNITWVELGPIFAPDERPHLGCQTLLGRDMVFGYDARSSQPMDLAGKWLQCF
jgi:hypothetical protein